MNRIWNEEVSTRTGIERELTSRVDQRVLRWVGHLERMNEYHMNGRVLIAGVNGRWIRTA